MHDLLAVGKINKSYFKAVIRLLVIFLSFSYSFLWQHDTYIIYVNGCLYQVLSKSQHTHDIMEALEIRHLHNQTLIHYKNNKVLHYKSFHVSSSVIELVLIINNHHCSLCTKHQIDLHVWGKRLVGKRYLQRLQINRARDIMGSGIHLLSSFGVSFATKINGKVFLFIYLLSPSHSDRLQYPESKTHERVTGVKTTAH